MKKFIFSVLSLILVLGVQAQCPTCVVDETVHPSTGPQDFGLEPEQITIQAGVDTTVVFQYLMPQQLSVSGVTATVTSVQILQVQNLPPATTSFCWTSDQAANNHTYYPQTYRYGCVTMQINTLAPAGVYNVNILVNGCGTAAGITQCQNQNIPLQVTVLPPAGNPFFSLSGNIACDSLNVDFEETIPDPSVVNPTSYSWDFGDGTTATGPTANHTFVGAGEYVVTLTEVVEEYYISAATVSATDNSCYCGDVEEVDWPIVGCTADPEPYLIINAGAGDVTLGNPASGTTVSWSGIDIPITSPAVSIQAWEEDGTSPDDNLGSDLITFTSDPGTGNISFSSSCVNGSITLSQRVLTTNTYYDTVTISQPSVQPIITNNGPNPICAGDSTELSASVSGSYQWYLDTVAIQGATNQTYMATQAGDYYVVVVDNGTICESTSEAYTLLIDDVTTPVIEAANASDLYVANPNQYAVEWFANGSGSPIPIPGANGDTLAGFNPANAPFTVTFTSNNGCEATSALFEICVAGTSSASGSIVDLSNTVDLTHNGFALKAGNDVAWAISTAADGPITDMTMLQDAIDDGWVIPSSSPTGVTVNCAILPNDLANGDYYFTPFTAAALSADSIIHQPGVDSGCLTDAQLCIELSATAGVLLVTDSLIFTFPDGSTANMRDIVPPNFASLIPDTIDQALINLLPTVVPGGSLCFPLVDVYSGDPNGNWSISALNVGTGSLTIDISDIVSTVYADSCPLITQDQVITIPGQSFTINPNSSASISFVIPPLPEDFPTLNADCNVIGDGTLLTIECGTNINEYFVNGTFTLYPNPNNGNFTFEAELKERSQLQFEIVDVAGRLVLSNTYQNAFGKIQESFELSNNLSSGFYVLNVRINDNLFQKHFIVK